MSPLGSASASVNWSNAKSEAAGGGKAALVKAAKAEGKLNVIALPSNWANYGKRDLDVRAQVRHQGQQRESRGSSAQEIQAIKTSRGRSSAPDVVDVGQSFAVASTSLFAPYKVAELE